MTIRVRSDRKVITGLLVAAVLGGKLASLVRAISRGVILAIRVSAKVLEDLGHFSHWLCTSFVGTLVGMIASVAIVSEAADRASLGGPHHMLLFKLAIGATFAALGFFALFLRASNLKERHRNQNTA